MNEKDARRIAERLLTEVCAGGEPPVTQIIRILMEETKEQ